MPGMPNYPRNLCEKHFPEPILFFLERPLCKKCVPEYMKQMLVAPNKGDKLSEGQMDQIALRLGLPIAALNAYSSEKNMIS